MKERSAKFKAKVTAWCGNCLLRVKFKFVNPHKPKPNRLGIYQCSDCCELKVLEFPELI